MFATPFVLVDLLPKWSSAKRHTPSERSSPRSAPAPSVPGQRQGVHHRLRCAAGRAGRDVAADAVDRALRATGRPRNPQGDGKGNCMVLDFAGNGRRHGPVDSVDVNVSIKSEARPSHGASVHAKKCPDCHEINPLDDAAGSCCGHEWPKPSPRPGTRPPPMRCRSSPAKRPGCQSPTSASIATTNVAIGRGTVVARRVSLRAFALHGIRFVRAARLRAHLRGEMVVRPGGLGAGAGHGGRSDSTAGRARAGGRDRRHPQRPVLERKRSPRAASGRKPSSRSTGTSSAGRSSRAPSAARALAAPRSTMRSGSDENAVSDSPPRNRRSARFAAVTRCGSATGRRNGSARR